MKDKNAKIPDFARYIRDIDMNPIEKEEAARLDLNPKKPEKNNLVMEFDKQQGRRGEREIDKENDDYKLDLKPNYKLTKKRILVLVDMDKDQDRF